MARDLEPKQDFSSIGLGREPIYTLVFVSRIRICGQLSMVVFTKKREVISGLASRCPIKQNRTSDEPNDVAEFKLIISEDGGVLLDLKNDLIHKLPPLGAELLRKIAKSEVDECVVSTLSRKYDIGESQLKDDLIAFRARLAEIGLRLPAPSLEVDSHSIYLTGSLPSFPWYGKRNPGQGVKPSLKTISQAYIGLMIFDFVLKVFSLKALCRLVKLWPVRDRSIKDEALLCEHTCAAVERACVWYSKNTLCLQRSAVTACLLRNSGLPAKLVIGTQVMPLNPHAWVEAKGSVVNDHKTVARVFIPIESY